MNGIWLPGIGPGAAAIGPLAEAVTIDGIFIHLSSVKWPWFGGVDTVTDVVSAAYITSTMLAR